MERSIIQSKITDNWQDPFPRKSPIIVTNAWSTTGLQCSASCPASPAAATAARLAPGEAAAAWPGPGAARDSLQLPELRFLTVSCQRQIRSASSSQNGSSCFLLPDLFVWITDPCGNPQLKEQSLRPVLLCQQNPEISVA